MTSQYVWQLKDRVIYAQLSGTVDASDLRKGNIAISRYIAESTGSPIHIQFDCRSVERIVLGVVQIHSELHYLQHPSLGWIVIFGMSGVVEHMVEFLTTIVIRLTGLRVYHAESKDDALAFLRRIDPTLPEVMPSVDVSV